MMLQKSLLPSLIYRRYKIVRSGEAGLGEVGHGAAGSGKVGNKNQFLVWQGTAR